MPEGATSHMNLANRASSPFPRAIFLGGMSAGALAMSRWSDRLKQPLWAYAAIEFGIGYLGLIFHDMFQAVTGWAYASV